MSAYSDAMSALNPINYWRLLELVGPTMADIGTAPVDGTYFSEAVFGRPSPIESDAAAFAVGRRVGIAAAPVPVDNFSFSGWGFYSPDEGVASGILCRNGQIGLPGSNMITIDHGLGQIGARLNPHGDPFEFFDLSYAPPVPGWYLATVTRNDTVMRLMVNDALVGERTDFPSGPFTSTAWINGGGFGWKVGVTGDSGNVWEGVRTAEPFVCDYPITLADQSAIYAAALNSLDLFGVSNVIPSAVLYSDLEPDPISFPFRHNWEQLLIERISFLTGISQTRSGAEEGNAARSKPRREIEWTQIIRDNDERQQLRAKLKAQQNRKWFIPILEHREPLSAAVSSGATSIPANTEYKDYQSGGYVHLRELNASGQIVKSEDLQIQSFTGSAITTVTPTVNSYAAILSQVCPARRGIISASVSAQGHTAEVEEINLTARLMAEDEPAIPNRIIPWEPTIIYRDHEVHDPLVWQSNDWSELRDYEIERVADYVDFETGIFDVESDTDGAAEAFSYRVKLKGIERIAEFLGWFYARAGSLVYLWVPSMQRDLTFISADLADMTVSGHSYTENLAGTQSRRDLAFVYNDNTMIFRRINSATTSGANDVLNLNTSPPTQTNLRSISYLKFCRLDADSLEKALVVDDVMMATWRFRELLHSPD